MKQDVKDALAALETRLQAVAARQEARTDRALRALAGMSPTGRINYLLELTRVKFDGLTTADKRVAEAELER